MPRDRRAVGAHRRRLTSSGSKGDLNATEDATIAAEAFVPPGTVEAIYGWIDDGILPKMLPGTLMEWHAIADQAQTGEFTVTHVVCSTPNNHQ